MALPHVPRAIAACGISVSHWYVWLHFVFATVLKLELHIDLADHYPNPGLFVRVLSTALPLVPVYLEGLQALTGLRTTVKKSSPPWMLWSSSLGPPG